MEDVNILVFGDSITYGALDNELGGWVNRLRLYLENNQENYYNVFNLGISGEITEEVLNRFKSECNVRYDKNEKTIIIFAIGINDTQIVKGEDRVSIEKFKSNIKELINQAKQFTDNILFVGLTKVDESKVVPLSWNKDKCYCNDKIIKFNNVIKEMCEENKVNYTEIYDLLSIEELQDGLHPNEKGHEKMFRNILNEIQNFNNK